MSGDQMEFVGPYRGYEVFAKPVECGTQYIAFERNDVNPAARAYGLPEIMGKIDQMVEVRKALEGYNASQK